MSCFHFYSFILVYVCFACVACSRRKSIFKFTLPRFSPIKMKMAVSLFNSHDRPPTSIGLRHIEQDDQLRNHRDGFCCRLWTSVRQTDRTQSYYYHSAILFTTSNESPWKRLCSITYDDSREKGDETWVYFRSAPTNPDCWLRILLAMCFWYETSEDEAFTG